MPYPVRGRAVKARAVRMLGASVLLLCALIAWGTIARRPASPADADSLHPAQATRDSAATPTPAADIAVPPRLQLERQCLALSETDPLAAMELAPKNNLTADDPGLLPSLVMQWASRDFDAACDWTKTQEAGPWRDNMLAHLAYLRSQTDPLAAARLVVTDIPPSPARDEAIISVVHQWALRDTEAAGLWAGSFDDEALRRRASAEVAALASSDTSREAASR